APSPMARLRRGPGGQGRPRGVLGPGAGQGASTMTGLSFSVVSARYERHAAVPTIVLRLRLEENSGADVHALALRCQIRIEPNRRQYDSDERARLYELFGEAPQWGNSL